MGQTEAFHGQRALSQLHRQKYVWNVSAVLFCQHVTGRTSWRIVGTKDITSTLFIFF